MASIFEAIRSFFHFVASSVSNIVNVFIKIVHLLGSVFSYVSSLVQMLPSWLYVVVLVLVVVCIIYKILGREGNA